MEEHGLYYTFVFLSYFVAKVRLLEMEKNMAT
jgi:hypothetical protein